MLSHSTLEGYFGMGKMIPFFIAEDLAYAASAKGSTQKCDEPVSF